MALMARNRPAKAKAKPKKPRETKQEEHVCTFYMFINDQQQQVQNRYDLKQLNREFLRCAVHTFSKVSSGCLVGVEYIVSDGIYNEEEKPKPYGRLVGVEYIISDRIYNVLPAQEQKLWHSHNACKHVKHDFWRSLDITKILKTAEISNLKNTYGKFWHTWLIESGDVVPLGYPSPNLSSQALGIERLGSERREDKDALVVELNEEYGIYMQEHLFVEENEEVGTPMEETIFVEENEENEISMSETLFVEQNVEDEIPVEEMTIVEENEEDGRISLVVNEEPSPSWSEIIVKRPRSGIQLRPNKMIWTWIWRWREEKEKPDPSWTKIIGKKPRNVSRRREGKEKPTPSWVIANGKKPRSSSRRGKLPKKEPEVLEVTDPILVVREPEELQASDQKILIVREPEVFQASDQLIVVKPKVLQGCNQIKVYERKRKNTQAPAESLLLAKDTQVV